MHVDTTAHTHRILQRQSKGLLQLNDYVGLQKCLRHQRSHPGSGNSGPGQCAERRHGWQ